MIKQNNTKSSRTLLLLISFAMLLFITACGGDLEDGKAGSTSAGGSISISSTVTSLAAGESSIITTTVTDGLGAPAQGKTVSFTLLNNNSNATITALNGGQTDAKGQAIATYTAGSNRPTESVQDMIQASASGGTAATSITRISSSAASTGLRMTLTADSTSLAAGQSTIVKATVTDGSGSPASGQAVSFTLINKPSGATLNILSLGVTDNGGQAQAIYTAGADSPTTSVQDTIQASITGATGVLIINRLSSSGAATGLIMTLSADATSLKAGESTIIKAMVTDGSGVPSVGQTVTFTPLNMPSGATLVLLNGGVTDASGQAIATYTAGSNRPTESVQDMIQASVTGTTGAVIITRTSGSGTSTGLVLTLTAASTSLAGGESTIITAKVTSGGANVQGQTVSFSFVTHPSGASLNPLLPVSTDAAGEATVLYTAGSLAAAVQDIVQAGITGSTKAIIITKTGSAASITPAKLDITASPTSIKTDGSVTSTITVHALNALNAEISGVVVTMGTDTGIVSAPTITTPGTVTLSSGGNKTNRTATITATVGSVSAQLPIQITGSTVTLGLTLTNISVGGTATLTVTVKDAGNNAVSNTPVTLSYESDDGGAVTFTNITNPLPTPPLSGNTNASGTLTATVTATRSGTVTLKATALDFTGTKALTVGLASVPTFKINNPSPDALTMGNTLQVVVTAPAPTGTTGPGLTGKVTFATTIGGWCDTSVDCGFPYPSSIEVPVGSGQATAYLRTTQAGIANIMAYDKDRPSLYSDSITVAMTSGAAAKTIFLQATPTVVSKSVGSTNGVSTLVAIVRDSSNYPVGGAAVLFSIVNSTGGGENISPVVAMTESHVRPGGLGLGEASASFTSGSLSSNSAGVQIRAEVIGATYDYGTGPLPVKTDALGSDATPNGPDATVVIGGTAGSVAFGMASTLLQNENFSQYIRQMSVMVTDSDGNPAPAGTVVSLSTWPVAFSTGIFCTPDDDGYQWYRPFGSATYLERNPGNGGTFRAEDVNENLFRDPGEDGARTYYFNPSTPVMGTGTEDGYLTPTNSAAGSVPMTVTTGANGVATFDLTYPKSSAIWIVTRIRASTLVQGSETVGQIIFRLPCSVNDCPSAGGFSSVTGCLLGDSPFRF